MQRSDTIAKVAAAVGAAQAELQNVTCDADNPHFRSKYASLPALLDTVRPVLGKHGLALVQLPISEEGRIGVETILLHSSGEWIGATLTVRPVKDDPQGAGSALTYCRRYSLAAALAIGQDDDDGNAAVGRGRRQERVDRPVDPSVQRAAPPKAAPSDAISEAQVKRFWAIARKSALSAGWPDGEADDAIKKMLVSAGIESSKNIPRARYDELVAAAEALFNG